MRRATRPARGAARRPDGALGPVPRAPPRPVSHPRPDASQVLLGAGEETDRTPRGVLRAFMRGSSIRALERSWTQRRCLDLHYRGENGFRHVTKHLLVLVQVDEILTLPSTSPESTSTGSRALRRPTARQSRSHRSTTCG